MTGNFCEIPRRIEEELFQPRFKLAGIDVDDVLAKTAESFVRTMAAGKGLLNGDEVSNTKVLKRLIKAYWSKDDKILQEFGISKQEYEAFVTKCFVDADSSPDYHYAIDPYSAAKAMVLEVNRRAASSIYLTSRFDFNGNGHNDNGPEVEYPNLYATQEWLAENGFMDLPVINRKEGEGSVWGEWKVDRALSLGVDLLIDDKASTVMLFILVARQLGKKVSAVLVAQPYNEIDKIPENVRRVPLNRVATVIDTIPKF